jgi:hypothetical protein
VNAAPDLPLHFADTLFMSAAFPLPSKQARALLPAQSPLHLVEVFPGRAVLVVTAALYRQSPFGTYSEAVLAVMTSHEKTTPVLTLARLMQQSRYPAHVVYMLVSSAEAQRLGDELWALPRLLGEVQIAGQDNQMVCEATIEGERVLRFVVDPPELNRTRTMQIETYSQRETTLLHSVMRCQAGAYGRTEGGGATLTWGTHAIGQRMATMGISAMPLMMRYYDQMQAELGAPEPCGVGKS